MAQEPTPFDGEALWTLAGSTPDGILYAVSIDIVSLQVKFWAYTSGQDRWTFLAQSDPLPAPEPRGHDALLSAIYNEALARVDVFFQFNETSSFLLRFLTGPPARLEWVISNTDNIPLQGVYGPHLHYLGNELIICGGIPDDPNLRICRIDLSSGDHSVPKSFTLSELWKGGFPDPLEVPRCVAVGARFLVISRGMFGGRLMIFSPTEGQPWPDPVIIPNPWPPSEKEQESVILYNIPPAFVCGSKQSDRLWYVPHVDPAKEGIVSDNQLIEGRSMDWSPDDSGPSSIFYQIGASQAVAVSSTHLFWVVLTQGVGYSIKSKKLSQIDAVNP